MPETLESLAAKITALSDVVKAGFADIETAIDGKIDEARAQLGVKIEAVDARVTQVYDAVTALGSHHKQNLKDHELDKTLEQHDMRLLALEHRAPRNRRTPER